MTELPKCGMVQRDSPRNCQNFVFKVKKINLIKFEIKLIQLWSFFSNHIYAPAYGK